MGFVPSNKAVEYLGSESYEEDQEDNYIRNPNEQSNSPDPIKDYQLLGFGQNKKIYEFSSKHEKSKICVSPETFIVDKSFRSGQASEEKIKNKVDKQTENICNAKNNEVRLKTVLKNEKEYESREEQELNRESNLEDERKSYGMKQSKKVVQEESMTSVLLYPEVSYEKDSDKEYLGIPDSSRGEYDDDEDCREGGEGGLGTVSSAETEEASSAAILANVRTNIRGLVADSPERIGPLISLAVDYLWQAREEAPKGSRELAIRKALDRRPEEFSYEFVDEEGE
ncbi:unnamed protein product [Protopolystoma xenopodis]|uniref:Uncharacterized protein n=1 Tax=Protopolystoma xenopodis TaxID=117903 RepID=A0A448XJA1_9PLAT|nr:unnamed protein product [Protopolystoma xenopodis]